MTDPLVPAGEGHTAIGDEDREGLIPTYIATRGELFAAEEANIATATYGLHPTPSELLDDLYLRRLHQAMFDRVWRWAGRYRTGEANIGIDPADIGIQVRALAGDATSWAANASFDLDELAVRFHHRLVQIHPFVNGNGRHGRVAADLLIQSLGRPVFGWGRGLDLETDDLRRSYKRALQAMDSNPDDVGSLIAFARSRS
jgi:Fic-DOC domain mobile mystery protein B